MVYVPSSFLFLSILFHMFFLCKPYKKTNRQQSNDQQIEKATPGTIFLQEYACGQSKKTINIKYIWVVLVIWMYQRQWQYYIFYCSFYIGVNYCGREEICSHIFHCSSFEIPYLEQLNSPQSGGECGRGKIKMLKWVELGRWGFIGGGGRGYSGDVSPIVEH